MDAVTSSWPEKPLVGPFVPDELTHAGSEHLDVAFVAGYDAKQKYDPSADVAALKLCGLDDRSILIDMGCGTGTFALAVAPHCRRVLAVDVSQPMLNWVADRAKETQDRERRDRKSTR